MSKQTRLINAAFNLLNNAGVDVDTSIWSVREHLMLELRDAAKEANGAPDDKAELLESLRWAVAALGYHGIDSTSGELDRAKQAIAKA